MEFYGPVSNLLVQVELATAFFPLVAHWLVFPTPLLMLSTKHVMGHGTFTFEVGQTSCGIIERSKAEITEMLSTPRALYPNLIKTGQFPVDDGSSMLFF